MDIGGCKVAFATENDDNWDGNNKSIWEALLLKSCVVIQTFKTLLHKNNWIVRFCTDIKTKLGKPNWKSLFNQMKKRKQTMTKLDWLQIVSKQIDLKLRSHLEIWYAVNCIYLCSQS